MNALNGSVLSGALRTPHLVQLANVMVSWALAGGVAGGVLIGGLVLTSRLHSMGIATLVVLVASLGSMLGVIHGGILGYLGRPHVNANFDWRSYLIAIVAAGIAAGFAVAFATWLAISAMAARAGSLFGVVALVISSAIAAAIFVWATLNGWRAIELAYARWPDKRLGTSLVLGASLVLTTVMLVVRGAIPGTGLQLSFAGSALLVVVVVLWIVSPVVIVTLRVVTPHKPML